MSNQTDRAGMTLHYGLIQSFYWTAYSALIGFSSTYLLSVGFQSGQIGAIVAVAAALSVVAQPLAASYADRRGGGALRRVTAGMVLVVAALAVILVFIHGKSLVATGLIFGLAVAVTQSGNGLINSLGVSRQGIRFGVSRAMGSVFYALGSAVLGSVVAALGSRILPMAVAGMELLLLAAVLRFPVGTVSTQSAAQRGGFFRRNPRFPRLMAACVCVYVSHVLLNNYMYQIILSRGGDSRQQGFTMALACFCEMFAMLLYHKISSKASSGFWLKVSTVGFTAKTLFTLLSPNIATLYLVQVLQMPAWGLMSVASVAYVYETVAPEDQARGQSYITTTYAVAMVFAAFLGGVLIDRAGVNAMLIFSTAVSAVGTVIQITTPERGGQHGAGQ